MLHNSESTSQCDVKYKIVFLGDMAVGKSSIIEKFIKGNIESHYNQTVAIDFMAKTVNYKQHSYRLHLWDTAGQEKFKSLVPAFVRGAHCAVIVYDICSRDSFEGCDQWLKLYENQKSTDGISVMVGNKVDLQMQRKVSYEEGWKFAQDHEVSFFELSAKTGQNLEYMFQSIIENINIATLSQNNLKQQGEMEDAITEKRLDTVKSQDKLNKKKQIQVQKGKRHFLCCYY